jgi:hypothetical protein
MRSPVLEFFTLSHANSMLPLLTAIVRDTVTLSQTVEQTKQRIEYLKAARQSPVFDEYFKELMEVERSIESDFIRLRELFEELARLNVTSQNAAAGFIDFPALRGDQPIHFCWSLNESQVLYWHEPSQDCSFRRALDQKLIRQANEFLLIGHS